MAAALTLMAKDRGDVTICHQVLLYPVTAADFDTASYHQFAEHYFLTREGMNAAAGYRRPTLWPATGIGHHRGSRCPARRW
jgi:acetyl esterase/lipase